MLLSTSSLTAQMRILRPREGRIPVQGHTVTQGQRWDSNPGFLTPNRAVAEATGVPGLPPASEEVVWLPELPGWASYPPPVWKIIL